jgi:hypothetical protein
MRNTPQPPSGYQPPVGQLQGGQGFVTDTHVMVTAQQYISHVGQGQSWPAIKQVIEAVARNIEAVAGGLSSAADQVFQAEEQTLSDFGRHAVDPRKQPGHGREPAF